MKIYHNPRCSKSRKALEIIKEEGIKPEIIRYLNDPMTEIVLKNLIKMLEIKPIDLIRKNEQVWQEKFKHTKLNDEQLVQIMLDYPRLIQRPIIVNKNKAVIGRSNESILTIIDYEGI